MSQRLPRFAAAADRKWAADDLYSLVRRAENFAIYRDSQRKMTEVAGAAVGALLLVMALSSAFVRRLPLTTAMIAVAVSAPDCAAPFM